jgi:hypothetical protein
MPTEPSAIGKLWQLFLVPFVSTIKKAATVLGSGLAKAVTFWGQKDEGEALRH